jgi:putative tryptophan/tyrosine transport system substrate-binding protein
VNRRNFITLLGGAAAAWPFAVRAQQGERMRRIGVLMVFAESDPEAQANVRAFREALQMRGWADGRNVRIDYRWGDANPERIRAQAIELVGLKPDVMLISSSLVLQPLRETTRSIPIVFTQIGEPVDSGFVASLAHPGGNVTGFATPEYTMYGKSLELLKAIAPGVTRVGVIRNPEQIPQAGMWRAIEAAAPPLRVQVTAADARDGAEIERAIDLFARTPRSGLIVLPSGPTVVHRRLIIGLAAGHRLPAVYAFRQFVTDGGLMSYGVDVADQYRQAAAYVDRILHGEKPGDLPVQQPTKFELVINLKTARALGLDVPLHLEQLADEVIE